MTEIVKRAENWVQMAGETDLEKKVNSYLTCQFILSYNVPADECLTEARELITMIKKELNK